MIASARRSLTEPPGLKASTLAYMVTLEGATRCRRTTGVRPMGSRMLSWIMAKPRELWGKGRRHRRYTHRQTRRAEHRPDSRQPAAQRAPPPAVDRKTALRAPDLRHPSAPPPAARIGRLTVNG